ncbi:MAG TPA: PDZ domain-containing protein [Blastocatellia bacterium]|nr:PDZ domain-containing protein [Blastocatellia bacterium]
MTKRIILRQSLLSITLFVILTTAARAQGQADGLRVDYTVKVANVEAHLFHVTADIKNIKEPRLDLSLPVWTPGWYTIENYAKNILRFHITDGAGNRLPHQMTRKQTWRVETKGLDRIKAEFDYRADVLALNQAKITRDFAFFTGTQLFLMAEGHRKSPSTVRFDVPEGWKIVTALKETSDPMVYSASDYDTLVDSTTELGNFDLTRFEFEGKPHYFVATPAGTFSKEKAERFTEILKKIAAAQRSIFDELPYEKFVYYYFFARPESNAGGALEHANSFVAFAPPGNVATPEMLMGTAAHEFFHVWNVKRIRPAEMWPYDYSAENYTPSLWVSEGFTNYYTNVSLYRAGLRTREQFLQGVSGAISGVENNRARDYVSPADASTSTWLGYDTPVAFGISYYTQGQNLGALLDLSLIADTGGKHGLDDLFRTLYKDFYHKGKGFTTEDLIAVIRGLTKKDYTDFFRNYIVGVNVPPYDAILGRAGYALEKTGDKDADLGFDYSVTGDGNVEVTRVHPNSGAVAAGLVPGDVILKIDGKEISRANRPDLKPDRNINLTIKRGGQEKSIDMKVGSRGVIGYKIIELTQATAEQLKVRERWLQTTTNSR